MTDIFIPNGDIHAVYYHIITFALIFLMPSAVHTKINMLFFILNILFLLGNILFFLEKPINQPSEEPINKVAEISVIPFSPEILTSMIEQADVFFRNGEYQNAIDVYLNILAHNPADYDVMEKLAHTYRYWNKYEESEKWFLKAVKINPNSAPLYTDLGKLYRNMNEPDKAEAVFQKSIEIDPMYDLTYSYGLGYLYFDQKRFTESEAMFLKALELNPTSEMAHMGLGDLYREMGKFQESEKKYRGAFEINPQSESYLGLGWLYIHEERYTDAVAALRLYIENIREKGEVYYTMGHAYVGLENFTEARKAFTKATELNPDNPLFKEQLERFNTEHPAN